MKVAIIYTSITGNTRELSTIIYQLFREVTSCVSLHPIQEFQLSNIDQYDGIVIGTYTWGDGNIPQEMEPLYEAIERKDLRPVPTGVFGTGDRFYPNYCGAVDRFRDMLFVQTELAVTLKVELSHQEKDMHRCRKFVDLFLQRCDAKLGAY
ncbi:flavodoxin domain-containing protein [Bacillus sp. FJAT-45350]|uniref:flavodoxin domain-containing protein n=1 Tax=Bacillus sp. FJAT-45350 TaxID=2011014 RepID=UPI000BB71D27|nr:flavodoxin domain-containing protein [Bacillus sp. FJAT-45350]